MRKVAKVSADERAAMAAQRAIQREANHCSSSEKKGFAQGIIQLAMPPTLRLDDRLYNQSEGLIWTSGARHWQSHEDDPPLPLPFPPPLFKSSDEGRQSLLFGPLQIFCGTVTGLFGDGTSGTSGKS